jgi:hypothetical protein
MSSARWVGWYLRTPPVVGRAPRGPTSGRDCSGVGGAGREQFELIDDPKRPVPRNPSVGRFDFRRNGLPRPRRCVRRLVVKHYEQAG